MKETLHIFPSTAAAEAFRRLDVEKAGVHLGISALTLKGLTEEICRVAAPSRRLISNAGRKLLLEEITRDQYGAGIGHFAPLKDFPGFVGALDSLFKDLKQALVGAEQLDAAGSSAPGGGKLAELAALLRRYNDALSERGLMDGHDLEQETLAQLRSGDPLPEMFDDVGVVEMHSIYDLTPLQLALTAEISRRLPVKIRIPYNPDRESLYLFAAKSAEAIEALDNSELMLEPLFSEPAGPYLTPILDAIHGDREQDGGRGDLPGPMALLSAPGAYRECEEIGRRVRRLLEEGADPSCIAVLFRNLKGYGPMLEDVCRRFRIPVSYRRGAPLHSAPLVKACLAPFAAVRSRLAREDILAVCNSTYLSSPGPSVLPDDVEEVLLGARYVDETMGAPEDAVDRRIAALRKVGRDTAREEGVRRYLRPVLKELRNFRGDKRLREFVNLLEGYMERHRLYSRGTEASDPRALKRDISAITSFRRVLNDLETDIMILGMAERRFSPAAFADLLMAAMEGEFLAGEGGAGVSILTFHDARGLHFDHLFMGGLNEGVTPMRHAGDPLFKDSAKLHWRSEGRNLFRTAAERGLEEPLLFYLAIGCADRSLTFSYSHLDGRGNDMPRSPLLEDILAKFPMAEARSSVSSITPPITSCLEREELLNSLARNGAFSISSLPGAEPIGDSLLRISANVVIEKEREEFFNGGTETENGHPSIYSGRLHRDDIVAELDDLFSTPPGNTFAPTILEEYGSCPFRYFLQRLIGVSPLEKPDLEIEAKDEGSLVHELLQTLFRRLADEGLLPIRNLPSAMAILGETAESVFSRWEKERYTGEPLLWEIGKERLLHILQQVVEMESNDLSGMVPRLFEFEFPVYGVAGSPVKLRGKIDRVDCGDGGRLRVVDYKMAGDVQRYREMLKKENLGVTSFQMPVYLLAAREEMEKTSGVRFDRLTALYWLLARLHPLELDFGLEKGGDFTGFFSTDPEERQRAGDGNFLNRLCSIVNSMKGGDFRVAPKECGFCGFRSVCRFVELPGKMNAD